MRRRKKYSTSLFWIKYKIKKYSSTGMIELEIIREREVSLEWLSEWVMEWVECEWTREHLLSHTQVKLKWNITRLCGEVQCNWKEYKKNYMRKIVIKFKNQVDWPRFWSHPWNRLPWLKQWAPSRLTLVAYISTYSKEFGPLLNSSIQGPGPKMPQ